MRKFFSSPAVPNTRVKIFWGMMLGLAPDIVAVSFKSMKSL